MCKENWKFVLLCVLMCGCAIAKAEKAPKRYYSHATELTLREAPTADAAALARLPINQPLFLLARETPNWCKVKLADATGAGGAAASEPGNSGREGYVGCAFLQEKPLDFAAIETEAARLFLALNQPNLAPADEARFLDQLFTQIERHFALSPSLYAYNDYRALLREARRRGLEQPEFRLQVREKKQAAMWRELSHQRWEREFPVVRQTVATSRLKKSLKTLRSEQGYDQILDSLPEYRPPGEAFSYESIHESPESFPAPSSSFFSQGKWAVGWAGGPKIRRRHGSYPPAYAVEFSNGGNEFLFDNLYEMVKVYKAPVHIHFVTAPVQRELSDTEKLETPILETKLPVWAITADGLVAGELRKARLGPDDSACFDSPGFAEFVFERPLKGRIYGVFASNAPIDPKTAKVTAHHQTSLTGRSLNQENARLTYREEASVDIDGDGVPDLRALLSTDQGANFERNLPRHALFTGNHGGFLRIAGYYDYNSYSLQVNEDGRWRWLYLYDLVTCT